MDKLALGDPVTLAFSYDPSGNRVGRHPYRYLGSKESDEVAISQGLYDGFGRMLLQTNFEPIYPSDPNQDPIGYKGQVGCYSDYESGLVYCHHRYYSPDLGRWLTRDPIGADGGINVYEFCGNNPIMGADPSGLDYSSLFASSLMVASANEELDFWLADFMGDHSANSDLRFIRQLWKRGKGGSPNSMYRYLFYTPHCHRPRRGVAQRDPFIGVVIHPDNGIADNAVTYDQYNIGLPASADPEDFLYSPAPRFVHWYNHEMGHVEQAKALGGGYLPRYLGDAAASGAWLPGSKYDSAFKSEAEERANWLAKWHPGVRLPAQSKPFRQWRRRYWPRVVG